MSADRQLGVDLFNGVWRLIESREDDDRLIDTAHASAYHWSIAPECKPENRARSEWLLSRAYALVGRPEPALHHAESCLAWCEESSLDDWDLAFAHEARAQTGRRRGCGSAQHRGSARRRDRRRRRPRTARARPHDDLIAAAAPVRRRPPVTVSKRWSAKRWSDHLRV